MKTIFALIICVATNFAWAIKPVAELGKLAPDFSLTGADGKTYKLSEFKGKTIILEWFNAGCPYVHKHYDSGNMQRLQTEYRGTDVAWFTIASNAKGREGHIGDVKEAKATAEKLKLASTALLIDSDAKVAQAYGAKTTPHMFVIDKKGLLAYNGAIDSESTARPMKLAEYKKDPKIQHWFEDAVKAVRKDEKPKMAATDPYGCSVKY
jgi:peroxiredoxin